MSVFVEGVTKVSWLPESCDCIGSIGFGHTLVGSLMGRPEIWINLGGR
jgi:hypothetical protein